MNIGIMEILVIVAAVASVPIALIVSGLLLKAACDLCSVEPAPHFLKCLLVAVVLQVLCLPLAVGIWFLGKYLGPTLNVTEAAGFTMALFTFLPAVAIVSIVTYILALRIGPLKSIKVWVINTLINAVVTAVAGLLIIGCWTSVESIRRLF